MAGQNAAWTLHRWRTKGRRVLICCLNNGAEAHRSPPGVVAVDGHDGVDGIEEAAAIDALVDVEAGADGISLINTLLGMRIDIKRRKAVLANRMGGYSGPGIFPVAVRCVAQVHDAVRIPIMGMGGISSAEDVIEMIMAGATAVQIGAANLVDPWACKRIIEELPVLMESLGIENLQDICGIA